MLTELCHWWLRSRRAPCDRNLARRCKGEKEEEEKEEEEREDSCDKI